jgi:hypothetical protein
MPQPGPGLYSADQKFFNVVEAPNSSGPIFPTDPYAQRKPDYFVGVFNVSLKDQKVAKPWVIGGQVIIAARGKDDPYGKPFILKDVETQMARRVGGDEMYQVPVSGTFIAQDIVNPNDPFGDWRTSVPLNPATASSSGNNLYEYGVFWSKLATPESEPDDEAYVKAVERLEKTYQSLVMEADKFYQQGPKGQEQISDPHHEAAEYFELTDRSWHQVMTGSLTSKIKQKKLAKEKAE